jgi:hypothetical protein
MVSAAVHTTQDTILEHSQPVMEDDSPTPANQNSNTIRPAPTGGMNPQRTKK